MRISKAFAAVAGAAAFSCVAASVCHAVELDPGSYVVLSSAASSPFAGETLVDSMTSAPFTLYETDYSVPISQWGTTPPQYLAATGSLTTSVYRAGDGTYGFAYTLNSQYNPQPFSGPPFNVVALPNLTIGGLAGTATDLSASRIPDTGTTGNHYLSVVRSGDGDKADVSFSDVSVPIEHTPHYYSLMAGAAPVTVYLQSDAKAYTPEAATLVVQAYDARYEQGGPILSFVMDSFSPVLVNGVQPPLVPEPLTIALLPMAVLGLGMRLRRRG